MNQQTFLSNQFLVAMPHLKDPCFERGVIYLFEHTEQGATGILINRPLDMTVTTIFELMALDDEKKAAQAATVLYGGPLHQERGFVIHSPTPAEWQSSIVMSDKIAMTMSRDILEALAEGKGPDSFLISLGFSAWGAGQLEQEIASNTWLICPADPAILFDMPFARRWGAAVKLLGVELEHLSNVLGHA